MHECNNLGTDKLPRNTNRRCKMRTKYGYILHGFQFFLQKATIMELDKYGF